MELPSESKLWIRRGPSERKKDDCMARTLTMSGTECCSGSVPRGDDMLRSFMSEFERPKIPVLF